MSKNFFFIAFTLFFLFFCGVASAQTTDLKNKPLGFQNAKISDITPTNVTAPDVKKIIEEDKKDVTRQRFAVPQSVAFNFNKSATILENVNGRRVYLMRLQSDKAVSLAFTLENLNIGVDENVFIYAADGKHNFEQLALSNTPLSDGSSKLKAQSSKLMSDFIQSDDVIIEFNQPSFALIKNPFTITKLWYGYGGLAINGFNSSATCEVNMACATDLQNQKRGVVRIIAVMNEGSFWGGGSLLNTTKADGTPYILTAFHIGDGLTPDYTQWKFRFNYELPTCANSTTEPQGTTIVGCTFRAGLRDDDFALLELSQKVPTSVNAFFNGWSRDTVNLSNKTAIIHHPWGDVKKITRSTHTQSIVTTSTNWTNGTVTSPYSHLLCPIDNGTLEPGSSGSPMFDANGRIVAQLHGADANANAPCNVTFGEGGRFAKSWDGGGTPATRLKDWLDPLQTNPLTLDGLNNVKYVVSGHVNFWTNAPMNNVKVVIGTDSTTTDSNGYFSFPSIAAGTALNVRIEKPDTYDNGVDATDILILRRHLIGVSTLDNSIYKVIAADIDQSGDVDATDLLLLRRFILGISTTLPGTPWKFILKSLATGANTYPPGVSFNNGYIFSSSVTNFDIQGIKIGDIDGSANY